jgi:hypothetical protein
MSRNFMIHSLEPYITFYKIFLKSDREVGDEEDAAGWRRLHQIGDPPGVCGCRCCDQQRVTGEHG